MISKRAQAWSIDLIIAGLVFSMGIIVLYVYTINHLNPAKDELEEMFYEANSAADLLLSNEEIGILSDDRINQTKLDNFYYLSDSEKKSRLGIRDSFYFVFDGVEINNTPVGYVGIINQTNTNDLVMVTRVSIYNNNLVKFKLFVWK